ncbi:MAG: transglycosylase SLT domain-containing protein [Myxococcales bacterium]|jgi:hypothetical protein
MYRSRFIALSLCIAFALVSSAHSQEPAADSRSRGARATEETVELLHSAVRARIAVSFNHRTGDGVPAAHCRHAPEGCERRLAEFSRYLVRAGQRFGVDPWLMAAMAFRESGFNPFALGAAGEMGILQINPQRRDAEHVRFMQDEWYRRRCRKKAGACQQEVVEHAARVLARSMQKCGGDVVDALGMYNTGRCGGNDRYAKRVLAERRDLRRTVGLDPPNVRGNLVANPS